MVNRTVGLVLVSVVALGGCFEGDLGRVVFDTNLVLDGGFWDPESAVADGQVAVFAPDHRVGDEQGTAPDVLPELRGSLELLWQEGSSIAVTGHGDRGRIDFDGEVYDRFRVRFERPERAVFVVHPGVDVVEEGLAILEGTEVELGVGFRDARNRPLGYAPDDFEVLAEGTVSVWSGEPAFQLVGDAAGEAGLVVALDGQVLPAPEVRVVTKAQVVERTIERWCFGEDACSDVEVGWTDDGWLVLGVDPG